MGEDDLFISFSLEFSRDKEQKKEGEEETWPFGPCIKIEEKKKRVLNVFFIDKQLLEGFLT